MKKRQITVPPLTDICEEAVFVFVFVKKEEGGSFDKKEIIWRRSFDLGVGIEL